MKMLRQKQHDLATQSAERATTSQKMQDHNSTSQVKVVRVNNFIQSGAPGQKRVANSHSPSGLTAGNSKDSQDSGNFPAGTKLKKGIKIVGQTGKSPYVDGHFGGHKQVQVMKQSAPDSAHSKGSRKNSSASDTPESHLAVFKQNTASTTNDGAASTAQTISNTSVQPQENMKLMQAIQRIKLVNPPAQPQQKSTTSASGKNVKVVSLQNQVHKKNAKSLNPAAVQQQHSAKSPVTQHAIYNAHAVTKQEHSESSQITIKSQAPDPKPKQHALHSDQPRTAPKQGLVVS